MQPADWNVVIEAAMLPLVGTTLTRTGAGFIPPGPSNRTQRVYEPGVTNDASLTRFVPHSTGTANGHCPPFCRTLRAQLRRTLPQTRLLTRSAESSIVSSLSLLLKFTSAFRSESPRQN